MLTRSQRRLFLSELLGGVHADLTPTDDCRTDDVSAHISRG
jgi:hypothetical protein